MYQRGLMLVRTVAGVDTSADQHITFLIFGGAGDLAKRLLIPGIGEYLAGDSSLQVDIVAIGRGEVSNYSGVVRDSLASAGLSDGVSAAVVERLSDSAVYHSADATDPGDLERIFSSLSGGERVVIYYALPPSVTADSVAALAEIELPAGVVIAPEKPFGESASGADELDRQLLAATSEDQVFRVDHFICESPVNNLVNLVESNAPFLASWNAEQVTDVEIVFDETLGLEDRAEFYDANGATRDMIQSHLLQVMAHILAAGGPSSALEILEAATVLPGSARRARYTAGVVEGRELPAYVDEEGVDPARSTETLVQLDLSVFTEQWKGVRVRLRSGKAIGDPLQAIRVTYRVPSGGVGAPARLVVPFADELFLEVNAPDHGFEEALQRVTLHSGLVPSRLTAYGRVARALIRSDHSVEVPVGTPQRAWEILAPVFEGFSSGEISLEEYPVGSQGPENW